MHTHHFCPNANARAVPLTRLPLATAICLAMATPAFAQTASPAPSPQAGPGTTQTASTKKPETKTLQAVVVTAQKRTENLQKVPISMDVLGEQQLQQLQVQSFKDYVKYLPGVTFQQGGGGISTGPGFASIYMRGVTAGGNANHSGSQPTVGVYLDDQPVTTIQGPVDIHMYDIARVEVLSGPQGTLYGASAEAGALRIITNQPDPGRFAANYSVTVNKIAHGGIGNLVEGMLNLPINDRAAVRLVAWHEHDAGYIDNAPGTRTFPVSGITMSNEPGCTPSATLQCIGRAKKNFNDVNTQGGRAALKIDLNDNWSITPMVMGQQAIAHGLFASDPAIGKLDVTHFYPDYSDDRWWQAALTVKGKLGNFDLTYTAAHMRRDQTVAADYSDYSFWYDVLYGYGAYIQDNSGALINPSEYIDGRDHYFNNSQELRIASPADSRLRLVAGVFDQNDKHDIMQDYQINGLATSLAVTGWPNTLWLTREVRNDSNKAIYGELSYDIIPDVLTATVGGRYYRTENHLSGFYGFSKGYFPTAPYGEASCMSPQPFEGAPCTVFDEQVKDSGPLKKFNLTWNMTPNIMLYLTRSEGFRPGGINRLSVVPPYKPDFLTNLEFGWKTRLFDGRMTFNGALFRERWNDFQFNVLGPHGVTVIENASSARILGLESQLNWQATYNLNLSAGAAVYNAKLTSDYCGFTDASGNIVTNCPAGTINPQTGSPVDGPQAPSGTRLPITPRFKANLIARYEFSLGSHDAFAQAALVHVGERTSDLRLNERALLGDLPAYTQLDLSAGIQVANWSLKVFVDNAFDKRGALFKYTECGITNCAAHNVVPQYPNGQVYTGFTQPRTIGITFKQDF
jgi:outer membrane receptor protein involved in Fe transport